MRGFIKQCVRLSLWCSLMSLMLAASVHAVILEGVGHASIHDDDLASARAEARNAAMRDLALQYEAQVNTSDTMENGVLTQSRMRLASSAKARNVKVIDEHRSGNLLRVTVRGDISAGTASCEGGEAARLKKRVAVTGFPLLYPDQARVGRIDDAGEILPQLLQQGLRETGSLQVFSTTSTRLFADLLNAPTMQEGGNSLTNVIQVAREMGVQFVVTGVIRDIGVADPAAWGSSVLDKMQRSIGASDMRRRFAVDMVVLDGFSGSPVYQQHFETAADWNAGPGISAGFGSAGFRKTHYGEAVAGVIGDMTRAATDALACQPFMTRITRVDGQLVTLASGATAGLRPGDELHLYRSARYFDSLGGTPELSDSQMKVTLNNVHPDFSNGRMPQVGGQVNIQRDDIAIIW